MPITRNQAKQYLQTGDYPTEAQFAAILDALLFSGEVQMTDIANLIITLQGKVELSDFEAFYKGELIEANGNYVYPQLANTLIEKIIIIPGADALIRIGTTNGGEEVMNETEVTVADKDSRTQVLDAFTDVNRDLYINGITAGSKLIILKRPLKIA